MIRLIIIFLSCVVLIGCTHLKVVQLDPKTGYFPTVNKADVITNKPFNMDQRKALILVPDSSFSKAQVINIGYFDEVISMADLEKEIILKNLGDKISGVSNRIGISNAARYYKPFLWLRYTSVRIGSLRTRQLQCIVTDPITMQDIFAVETFYSSEPNDQDNWYPMFNALIDYIKQNSNTFRK